MADSTDTALKLYELTSHGLSDVWTHFAFVGLGVLGFIYRDKAPPKMTAWILGIAFTAYSIGNHVALYRSQESVVAAVAEIRSLEKCDDKPPAAQAMLAACGLKTNSVFDAGVFHVVVTVFVIVAMALAPKLPDGNEKGRSREAKSGSAILF